MNTLNISFYVLLLSVAFARFTAAVPAPDSDCDDGNSDDVDGAGCK
jgi:hypothetical protein